jgi:GTP cyclohydrolase-4
MERVIHLATGRRTSLFYAILDIFVDLPATQKGAHMSRFPHEVEAALEESATKEAPDIESLAARIATGVLDRQGATRAECHIRAKVPRTRHAPLSGQLTQEVFTLIGCATTNGTTTARLVGVETDGMTACPCAQDMMRDHARSRLIDLGFPAADADRALDVMPIATHSQRGRGTLIVSAHPDISADDLVRIVEASMSSEVYGVLKRPDEFFIVNRAHRHPKFVEDVVRDMLAHVLRTYPELPDDAFVLARQVNFESIHKHDVTAERGAALKELRREVAGEGGPGESWALEAWLHHQVPPATTTGG